MRPKVQAEPRYVFDTSALVCYLADEKGAAEVARLKREASLPFIVLSELYYLVWGRHGRAEADRIYALVKSWRLPILMPNERVILIAGRLKAVYKLGIADSYIAAFAQDGRLSLVTKDQDYEPIGKEKIDLYFIR